MDKKIKKYSLTVIDAINKGTVRNKKQLNNLKIKLSKEFELKQMPTDPDILAYAKKPSGKLKRMLSIKKTRILSGIASVAIMTSPKKCPHGKCAICPGGVDSYFGDVPQSYTGREPATMRAIANLYDPYLQVMNRVSQYYIIGHNAEKVELIVMGGTFPARSKKYRDEFVGYALKAMNDFGEMFYSGNKLDLEKFNSFFEIPHKQGSEEIEERIKGKLLERKGKLNLEKEKKRNETAEIRNVATCIETRPDYCKGRHINEMLRLGTTRVELGVQSIYGSALKKIKRGHRVEDSVKATQLLKDSFLKVAYHIIPGLPGSSKESDIEMFRELFNNQDFMPDGLKIYPCMVIRGTKLYDTWKQKRFRPLTTNQATEIIARGKEFVPGWCRVMRVQRDIPTNVISAGVDMTNLRQVVQQRMKKRGKKCRCIRCREIGLRGSPTVDKKNIALIRQDYEASNGQEVFLSVEDAKNDLLLGFCRLRIPWKPIRKEITNRSAGIRELHVYGEALAIGKRGRRSAQHLGYGKMLVQEVERIAKEEFGINKMLVISGLGAREYYIKKLGYKKDGFYVSRKLG